MLMFQTLSNCPGGGGGGDLSRSPPEFRWCWPRRPWLEALHIWGVHVMTRRNDSRLEGLLATTVLDCRRLRGHCLDVADAPALSGGGPQSVPSRISVVLVDGANAGGTPRRECPREDQDIRSIAGVTKPASVTMEVRMTVLDRRVLGGTLSSSDTAGRLLPVVPTGGSSPVGPIDPAGPDGPVVAGGPVGPDVTLSPFILDLAGRHVAIGPVAPFGMLSPSDCHPAGPVIPNHASPAGWHVAIGPQFCPDVLEDDLVLGAAVPLPAVEGSRVASSPGEMLVGNGDVTIDGIITAGPDGWSAPEMVGSSSGVVRAGCVALPRCTDTTTCVDECTEGDILDQFEIRIGMIRMRS